MKGKLGTSVSGIEVSPARKKRMAKKRQRQEASWAARSGPVTVRHICPRCRLTPCECEEAS